MSNHNNPQTNGSAAYFATMGSKGVKFDPSNFRIEGGVTQVNASSWQYFHTSNEYPGGIVVYFTSEQKPILGDQVVNNVLVPRPIVPNPARDTLQDGWPKPIVNNEPGFQDKHVMKDTTWPDNKPWIDIANDR